MNTDYTDFIYNALEPIHGILCNTRWRDSLANLVWLGRTVT